MDIAARNAVWYCVYTWPSGDIFHYRITSGNAWVALDLVDLQIAEVTSIGGHKLDDPVSALHTALAPPPCWVHALLVECNCSCLLTPCFNCTLCAIRHKDSLYACTSSALRSHTLSHALFAHMYILNGIRHKADLKRTTTTARHLDFERATCRRRRRQRRLLRV